MFAAADELFDDAVGLALTKGDAAAALAYAERGRARELLESITAHQPSAAMMVAQKAVAAREVAVVEYASLPSVLVIFVAAGGQLRAVHEPVERSVLADDAERLAHGATVGDAAEFEGASSRLYRHLFAPIADAVRPGVPVVFVPDATLRDVSFAALANPAGRYLIEDHTMVVAPSAAIHTELASRTVTVKRALRLLLVAGAKARQGELGYLSGADREADAIAALYRDTVRLSPRDGKADVFGGDAATADVIHFTGHASSDNGRGPALLTSGAGVEDRLDIRSIAAANLRQTRVVVLAACSTAAGEERAREGSISIARAFLAAGVPSVVATLWPIDDRAAADFFPRLHRHLARGLPPGEALRFAQIESIHGREAPPFMWAAVQVIGS
jgi:CHAT domain-containing protein